MAVDVNATLLVEEGVTPRALNVNDLQSGTYTTRVDEASSTVTYVGEAAAGAGESSGVWRVKRVTTAGTVLLVEWADGTTSFDNVWTNRASLTYL